jgi:Leucine-rich repeat (LRR) protein
MQYRSDAIFFESLQYIKGPGTNHPDAEILTRNFNQMARNAKRCELSCDQPSRGGQICRNAAIQLRSPDHKSTRKTETIPTLETSEALFIAMSESRDPNATNPSDPGDAPGEEKEEEEATETEENKIDPVDLDHDSLVLRGSTGVKKEVEDEVEAAADEEASETEETEIDPDLDTLAYEGLVKSQPHQDSPVLGSTMDAKRADAGSHDDEEKQEEAPGAIENETVGINDLDDRLIERMESQKPASSQWPPGKFRLSQRAFGKAALLRSTAAAATAASTQGDLNLAAAPGGGVKKVPQDDVIDTAEKGAIGLENVGERFAQGMERQRNDDREFVGSRSDMIDQHLSFSRSELLESLTETIWRGEQVDETLIREYNEASRLAGLTTLESQPDLRPVPGAFWVVPGRTVERASAAYTLSEDSVHSRNEASARNEVSARSPPTLSAQSSAARTLLVEANLVGEEENESHSTTILVEAKPIRRIRQLVIVFVVIVAIALIVGLSVGLTSKPAPLTTTTSSPTGSPTSELEHLFRQELPQYTVDILVDTGTPQFRAYEWATEADAVPERDARGDEELLLERMKQRFALATLYYATGGENSWTNKEGWLNATAHECSWSGCCCGAQCLVNHDEDTAGDGDRQLVQLSLRSNSLQQSLPLEIGLLLTLTSLSLNNNDLRGSIPSTVSSLTNLVALDLSYNRLTMLPTTIGLVTALSSLSASHNDLLFIPSELGNLTTLQNLDLSYNAFNGSMPSNLGQLSSMVSMSLECGSRGADGSCSSGIGHKGPIPTELGNLLFLTSLDLSWNQLSRIPTEIGLLTNLLYLDFDVNAIEGPIPVEIARLSALTSLDISTNWLSSSIPTQLGLLSKLVYLGLESNSLTGSIPTELGQLSGIVSLDLSDNQLNSTIPTQLGRLSKLLYLSVGSYFSDAANSLTGPIPTELGMLTALTSLLLASMKLNSTIPTQMGHLSNLYHLALSTNSLIGPLPAEIGQMSDLYYLDISSNHLRVTIPTELGDLSKLNFIDFSRNALTGPIPTEFSRLSSLYSLDGSSNMLNWTIPTQVGRLTALWSIDLSNNSLSGPIPTELGLLSALFNVHLYSNRLTSSIPFELGLLSNLASCRLGQNRLTGSVPTELCQLNVSDTGKLVVDCEAVACDCNCSCAESEDDDFYYGDGVDPCVEANDRFEQCVEANGGIVKGCIDCISRYTLDFFPTHPGMCTEYEPMLCREVGVCPPCGPCTAEDVQWTNCLLSGICNAFTCPGPSPGNESGTAQPSTTPPA